MWRALLVLALLGLSAAARADSPYADPAERRFSPYVGDIYPCDEPAFSRASRAFAHHAGGHLATRNLKSRFRSHPRNQPARQRDGIHSAALLHRPRPSRDNSVHTVIYEIEEGQGIIGFGDGVEYCIVGLDRMFAFSPACSSLRPFAERFLGSKALVEKY